MAARTRPGTDEDAPRGRVLVVDDSESIRTYLANLLGLWGYAVDTAEEGRRALELLAGGAAPDVVLLDVMMPGMGGIETLERIRERHPDLPVLMLSVVGTTQTIVRAMQAGATDYLNKPFEEEELQAALAGVLEQRDLERERERLVAELESGAAGAVWESAAMQRVRGVIEQIADTNVTVLIQGESGVGKEIVARTVHDVSTRASESFVKVNCAALPEDLLESELFGFEKGAFTGATHRKPGRFEVADRGTIFLDEIGEMSPGLQAKLLQVLQDQRFSRLGGNKEIQVDVRVVCATNRPLEQMVQEGGFREDLYYRLNVVGLHLPPLRERREEIPKLVETFLRRYAARYRKPEPRPSARLMRGFERYPFPGNVRELENMIKRIVVLESEESILDELYGGGSERTRRSGASAFHALLEEVEATAGEVPLKEVGRRAALEAERQAIERVLHRTRWNRKQAASILGVSYKTLLQKIRECGLTPD